MKKVLEVFVKSLLVLGGAVGYYLGWLIVKATHIVHTSYEPIGYSDLYPVAVWGQVTKGRGFAFIIICALTILGVVLVWRLGRGLKYLWQRTRAFYCRR